MSEHVTHKQKIGGFDFEIDVVRDGDNWRWFARKEGKTEVYASGVDVGSASAKRALKNIAWEVFNAVVRELDPDAFGPQADEDGRSVITYNPDGFVRGGN